VKPRRSVTVRRYHRTVDPVGLVAAIVLSLSACGDPVASESRFIPTDKVFWKLTLNHRSVNLSRTPPYDTLQLIAIPRNIHGEPLPDVPPATFRSSDSSVLVFPDGHIQARAQQPNARGTQIIATLTYNGVTRSDTAYVTVTNTPTPPVLGKFVFEVPPGDSTRLAAEALSEAPTVQVPLIARDTAGNSISRLNVFYESSDPSIATIDRFTGVLRGKSRGTVTVYASAMVYGIEKRDSIQYTVTDPLLALILLVNSDSTLRLQDLTVYLAPGGNVVWTNQSFTPVDIVFDKPEEAQKATGAFAFFGDTTGNIAPFASVPGADPILDQFNQYRVRSFPNRGTYRYWSTQYAIRGTIIVR
jgi:hypothetical protein